jgi:hypothetical protein
LEKLCANRSPFASWCGAGAHAEGWEEEDLLGFGKRQEGIGGYFKMAGMLKGCLNG